MNNHYWRTGDHVIVNCNATTADDTCRLITLKYRYGKLETVVQHVECELPKLSPCVENELDMYVLVYSGHHICSFWKSELITSTAVKIVDLVYVFTW